MNSYGKRTVKPDQRCAMKLLSAGILIALAIGLGSCSQEQPGYTEKERLCIAQHDPKQLSQCVDVCKACLNGTIATCNMSCKLKGAT
jgi:hypothetical protein